MASWIRDLSVFFGHSQKVAMDAELEKPLAIRAKAAERLRETQLLKKKNQELTNMTRKLEEKVKTLEKVSQ